MVYFVVSIGQATLSADQATAATVDSSSSSLTCSSSMFGRTAMAVSLLDLTAVTTFLLQVVSGGRLP